MIRLIRTSSTNPDFIELVNELDSFLKIYDGEDHAYYSQFNKIDSLKFVVVAYDDTMPVGCGAIKHFSDEAMEIKRMYVKPKNRGEGIAASILKELENWAAELNYTKCILETGAQLPEAINLYKKSGYQLTPNYGQYVGIETSLCFEKTTSPKQIEFQIPKLS